MIRFACSCGKKYGVDDSLAGRMAKCRSCGASMAIPVFVHTKNGSNKIGRSLIVFIASFICSVLLIILIMQWSDNSRPKPGQVNQNPVNNTVIPMIGFFFQFGIPFLAPAAMSRRGCLSVGRWVCASLLCFVFFCFLALMVEAEIAQIGSDKHQFRIPEYFFFAATPGCLIAAIVHPKDPPKP